MQPVIRVGVSYDLDQYERLEGKQPALINLFKLKAMAHKIRHRAQGVHFKRPPSQSAGRDSLVSSPELQECQEELLAPEDGQSPGTGLSAQGDEVVLHAPNNCLGLRTIFAHPLCLLLLCVPMGLTAPRYGNSSWTFWLNFLSLVPLAKILGDATEELAASLGNETVSGLLNASFGNAVEMIVAVQALRKNVLSVVKLSLLGSVLSNILLVLGSAFLLGGLTPSATPRGRCHSFLGAPDAAIGLEKEQKFPTKSALLSVAMLLFSCTSFALPTMFSSVTDDESQVLKVSRIGACIVASTYVAFLAFQLFTHTRTLSREEQGREGDDSPVDQGADAEEEDEEEAAGLSAWCAILLMAACTVVTSFNSELMVEVLEDVVRSAGIPETFIGVILLPIAGNACEHASALRFAAHDRPGLAIGISVGSSTQVALLVVPFAVIVGWFMDKPLDLNFGALNTLVVTFSVLVVLTLLLDGRSNWMKGYLLVALYVFIAALYWFIPFGRTL